MDGIIEHKMGKIHLIELPSPAEGGTRACNIEKIRELIERQRIDRIGVSDVVAKALLKKMGKPYDFEFACAHAIIEAAQRGLNVLLLGWGEGIKKAVSDIEEFNASFPERIQYKLISF